MANEFQQRMRRLEERVRVIEDTADPHLRANGLELIRGFMELHGTGLERMIHIIAGSGAAGQSVLSQLAADEPAASLLLLYGLHPVDIETRVRMALDKVGPYLKSHGGSIELIGIAENVVTLRLNGTCKSCPSSRMTLDLAVEQAIYEMAPDVEGIEVEGVSASQNSSLPTQQTGSGNGVSHAGAAAPSWENVGGLDALATGAAQTRQVDGRTILFCRLGETLYAYDGFCAACAAELQAHELEAGAIICSSCGQRYDVVRAGRGIDKQSLRLTPFPLLHDRFAAKIALPSQS